ncbi:MAG: zf-HC2 domain-containing protein [Candidatus Omnitrophota bacterium]|nr:zf-HC2 domain-containing protein [Candidatus Omnitrophota bacterium]
MFDYFEKITKLIYSEWKGMRQIKTQKHPDEEDLACFIEGKLSPADKLFMEKHLVNCDVCAEYVGVHLAMHTGLTVNLPDKLLEKVRKLVLGENEAGFFEILLKLKEKAIEIIQTSGDVLVGQELIPAPILRSRQIRDFKEEITILKDLQKIRVETKLKNNNAKTFDLEVSIKDKESQGLLKDLRITLLRDGLELESYASNETTVIFKDVYPGIYTVEITTLEEKIATVAITVKV